MIVNKDILYRQIGERIRTFREAKQISQEELARRVGLSRAAVVNIEKGRQRLLVDQIFTFAGALSIDFLDLLPISSRLSAEDFHPRMPSSLTPSQRAWAERVMKHTKLGGIKNGYKERD